MSHHGNLGGEGCGKTSEIGAPSMGAIEWPIEWAMGLPDAPLYAPLVGCSLFYRERPESLLSLYVSSLLWSVSIRLPPLNPHRCLHSSLQQDENLFLRSCT